MNEKISQRGFLRKCFDTLVEDFNFIKSLEKKVKFAFILIPSGLLLLLSIVFIILLETIWTTAPIYFWSNIAIIVGIICYITLSIWIITSKLSKTIKYLYFIIPTGLISISMIVVTIIGATVWYSGLAVIGWGFIALVSGVLCITIILLWRIAIKSEKEKIVKNKL